jgi:hypothetical protein
MQILKLAHRGDSVFQTITCVHNGRLAACVAQPTLSTDLQTQECVCGLHLLAASPDLGCWALLR